MNAPAQFPSVVPFNSLKAYHRERNYSRKVERMLARSLDLLTLECSRRELRGEDVAHIRSFIAEARDVSL